MSVGHSERRELTDDDPCPGCGGSLTWCDCLQGEHLICLHCGDDAEDCQCVGIPVSEDDEEN